MINGLGVLGLGGRRHRGRGRDARPADRAAAADRASACACVGALPAGTTATDLVLTLTQMLRAHGVVGSFVEFTGDGLSTPAVADRATLVEHVPGVRRHVGVLPGRRRRRLTYLRFTDRGDLRAARGALREGAGAVPVRRRRRAHVHRDARPGPPRDRAVAGRARSGRRTAWRCPTSGTSFVAAFHEHDGARPEGRSRSARSWPRAARRARITCRAATICPTPRSRPTARRVRDGVGRDRGDHLVHEHLEPVGDGRGRAARQARGRGGARSRSRG